ncbi:MAG: hypothetical protein KA450_05145 [Bacteroidia bacterium]|nr:hypothetical protein [Bacteroidia bacterium]
MKSVLSSLLLILLGNSFVFSQSIITLQHNGTSSFHNLLDSAIFNSQNGDTIYLPGGVFSTPIIINKSIAIVGAGHHPDSTLATNFSWLSSTVKITNAASGGSISGCYLSNGITFGTNYNDQGVTNYIISRCNLNGFLLASNGADTSTCNNILITECVIRGGVAGQFSQNVFFTNNIFNQLCASGCNLIDNMTNCLFYNNIFLHDGSAGCGGGCPPSRTLINVKNSFFYNNIFKQNKNGTTYGNNFQTGCTGNFYKYNIFEGINSQDWFAASANYLLNNQFSISFATLFVNQTGATYNYSNNYHLQNASSFLGEDGTQVGVYGGASPWKEGSVPFNPHIQFKNIANTTDSNGNLNINIQVGAQDH